MSVRPIFWESTPCSESHSVFRGSLHSSCAILDLLFRSGGLIPCSFARLAVFFFVILAFFFELVSLVIVFALLGTLLARILCRVFARFVLLSAFCFAFERVIVAGEFTPVPFESSFGHARGDQLVYFFLNSPKGDGALGLKGLICVCSKF